MDGEASQASISYTVIGPPTVRLFLPASGAKYAMGQVVATSFSCSEVPGGPGLTFCDDYNGTSTASGGTGHLDTSTLGAHTYTVIAASLDGLSSQASISYTVTTPAPILSALKLTPSRFRAAASGPSTAPAAGSLVSYSETTAATTTLTVTGTVSGIRRGAKCVASSGPVKHGQTRCVFTRTYGAFTHTGATGRVSLHFTGRVGGRTLAPGAYKLTAIARSSAGPASSPLAAAFTIVP
jgi:hypothetical protein